MRARPPEAQAPSTRIAGFHNKPSSIIGKKPSRFACLLKIRGQAKKIPFIVIALKNYQKY
jgi:hypothetical protein